MATWLLEGELSVLLFIVLAPILVAPFLAVVYRRYRYPAPGPTLLAAATGLYACSLIAFTTFPLPEAPEGFCTERRTVDYWQLAPGSSVGDVLDRYREVGLASTLTSGVFLQVSFNVVFFMPLGFLVAYWLRRSLGVALLVWLVTSLLIEATQGTGLWGVYPCPYRLADVDDLITNTGGALIGWTIGALAWRLLPLNDPPRRVDLDRPTVRRRVLAAGLDVIVLVVIVFTADVLLAFLEASRGVDVDTLDPWFSAVQYTVGALLLLVVPLLGADRATPGQATVLLALASRDGPERARLTSVVIRFLVRWLPILIWGAPAIAVVALVELVVVAARKDRASLTGLIGRTVTVTHDQMHRSTAGPAARGRVAPPPPDRIAQSP